MKIKFIWLFTYPLIGFSFQATTAELEVNPSISTSLISAQNNSVEFAESDSSILSVKPSVRASYKSKLWVGGLSLEHNEIQSETTIDGNRNDSFTNYQYSGDISLIDEILSVRINGGQSYRSILSSQYFVNDSYLGADDLSKTTSNGANLLFNIPARKYFGLNINAGVSKVKSDRSTNIDPDEDIIDSLGYELNNENQSLQASFYQGRDFSQLSWNLSTSYQNTSRSNDSDFTTKSTRGDVKFGLISNLRLVLTGQIQENDLGDSTAISRQNINFESIGAGLSWIPSEERSIQVTYNQYERSGNDTGHFGALDLNWVFTSRTSIQASIGRRFYGRSGRFSLTHNTRRLRTQIGYNEEVTTFSRLITNNEDPGVFLCLENSFSFGDCVLPPTLSPDLQPGEEFSNLLQQIPEISEEAILRKTLNASFGYQGRRLTSALSFRHLVTESLQSIRKRNSDVITLSNSYKASRKTSFNLSLKFASTEEEATGLKSETNSTSFGISRNLGRNMSTNLDFRYLDRSSNNADLITINSRYSNLTDKRLTLEFVYDF